MVTRPDPRLETIVSAAVDGGVNIVQVRGSADVLPALCARVPNAKIVVNAALWHDSAVDSKACAAREIGVHLPEAEPFINASFVGRSVHSVEAAVRAEEEGCEYVVAGTIFPSASHPGGPVAGVQLIKDIADEVAIPVVAIGGITPANARACIDAGASGVAVVSYLMDAADPRAAARELVKACN